MLCSVPLCAVSHTLTVQARLGEVNQPIRHEDHAQALIQRSYPEGSTSRRLVASQHAGSYIAHRLSRLCIDFLSLQIAAAIKVGLPEQTQLQTCHRFASRLHVHDLCHAPVFIVLHAQGLFAACSSP